MQNIIYHIVPKHYLDALDPQADYVPAEYSRDGFIHCTDTSAEMEQVANRYYRANPEPYMYLYIDKTGVRAPMQYIDPARVYTHIHGPLNRDAIIAVRPARRTPEGAFLPPEPLDH